MDFRKIINFASGLLVSAVVFAALFGGPIILIIFVSQRVLQ